MSIEIEQERHLQKWDLFISYAAEDRETVVTPLVEALRSKGLKVWYDIFELTPGKFLLRSIDEGLRESRFGIVVLSPNFFAKEWPMRELSGLYNRSIREGDRPFIVPIWYNLSASDVASFSPIMSDVVAIRWEDGIEDVVQTILAIVKSEWEYTPIRLQAKVYGEIYQALATRDYIQGITQIYDDYPPRSIRTALISILFNEQLNTRIRIRSLQTLVELGLAADDDFDTILREENTELLRELIAFFTKEGKVILSREQLELLFSNPRLPRSSKGLGDMVKEFIERGASYTTSIFLAGATYPSWEVKYDCVKTIIDIDDEDSLQTLASFSTMSYWVARKRIITYIHRKIEAGSMSISDKSIAQQILSQIISDGKTAERTPTMRLARETSELLRGRDVSKKKEISVLFLSADPTNASRIRLGEEFREIQEKIQLARQRELFDLHFRTSVRPEDISQAMLDVRPSIVHFSGHGSGTGELCFENRSGVAQPVSPEAIADLFSIFSQSVNCVILNACYSERQVQAISKFVPYVIGMKQAIGDRAAIAFSVGFYQALGAGLSIEDAYKLGCVQISLQGIDEQLVPVLLTKDKVVNCS